MINLVLTSALWEHLYPLQIMSPRVHMWLVGVRSWHFWWKRCPGRLGGRGSWHLWLDRTNVSLSETITRHTLGCFRRRPSMFLFCFGLFDFCLCMCVDFLRTVWLVSPVLTSGRKKGKTTYQSPKAHTDTLMYQQNQIIADECYLSEIQVQTLY